MGVEGGSQVAGQVMGGQTTSQDGGVWWVGQGCVVRGLQGDHMV